MIKQKQRAAIMEALTKGKDVFVSLPNMVTRSLAQSTLILQPDSWQ